MNSPRRSETLQTRLCCGLLVLAAVAAYLNSLNTPFLFDDIKCIKDKPLAHQLWPLTPILTQTRRPLLYLSLAVNHALGGLEPLGYHVMNLLIHVVSAIVLLLLVDRLVRLPSVPADLRRSARWLSCSAALIWMVHPLQTESVTYVIQRSESGMGLFYLLSIYCLVRASRSHHRGGWLATAVVAFYLGLGFKEVILTAPLIGLLIGRVYLYRGWPEVWRGQRAYLLGVAPALLWLGWRVFQTMDPQAGRKIGFAHEGISWWEYLISQPGVIVHYLRLTLWPNPLCLDYGWPVARSLPEILVPGSILVLVMLVTGWLVWRYPRVGFLAAAPLLILAPTSSIFPISDLAFEHRMYLPLAPLVVLALLLVHQVAEAVRARQCLASRSSAAAHSATSLALVACLALVLLGQTAGRNLDYSSPLRMWGDVVRKAPDNPRGHYNFGLQLDQHGLTAQAMEQYQQTLALAPREFRAHFNLAGIYHRQANYPRAIEHYRCAIEIKPHHYNAHSNLASVYCELDDYQRAQTHYQRALQLQPDDARMHDNLGNLYARQGQFAQAILHYQRAISLESSYWSAHWHLGVALYYQQQYREAAESLRTARHLQPEQVAATRLLAHILAAADDPAVRNGVEAMSLARDVVRRPGYNGIRSLAVLAEAHAERGDFPLAVETAQRAYDKATAADRQHDARYLQRQLQLYHQRTPFRMRDCVDDIF